MKQFKLPLAVMSVALALFGVAGCSGNPSSSQSTSTVAWDFNVTSDTNFVMKDGQATLVVTGSELSGHTFEFTSSDPTIATVAKKGDYEATVTGVNFGVAVITVASGSVSHTVNITVAERANGTYSYAGSSYEEKGEILGLLEKYAVDNHIAGLPLYEDGGLVMYNPRIQKGTEKYISGYGFGILGEGKITADLEKETTPEWKRYYHSAQSSDPYDINDWDADGSAVSDLASYVRSSYWDVKMNATKDGYDWYPVLAKEMPQAVEPAADGRSTTWKFKVNTAADGLKYATSSTDPTLSQYNGRGVTLDDYVYTFKMLLTGKYALYRGAELAGETGANGIAGAAAYYQGSKAGEDDALFARTVKITADPSDNSLQFTLQGPVNQFYAMYYLASGLYQPIPKDFITAIGGPKQYGRPSETTGWTPVDTSLSLSSYMLERWDKGSQTVFTRNPDWIEFKSSDPTIASRHSIAGVHIRTNTAQKQDETTFFTMFLDGQIDAAGIPASKVAEYKNDPRTTTAEGSAVFKLNINACTEEQWIEKFGKEGTITQTPEAEYWDVKPWMGNSSFLDGIFFSINRQEYADNRGVIPSENYFSNAYLINPEEGVGYNTTEAHKKAMEDYYPDTFGFNFEAAKECFKNAVDEMVDDGDLVLGTVENPTKISFEICWMYQSQIKSDGEDVVKYIEDAFNDEYVCGNKVVLDIEQDAVAEWSDVYYNKMMVGQFDLAFGSISGNTLNPLNFMEVLKSDNSSGFTLNWGADTNECDDTLFYDGKTWSFDALYDAADHGAVVSEGRSVNPLTYCAVVAFDIDPVTYAATIKIDFAILDGLKEEEVKFFFNGVTLYDAGGGEYDLSDFITGFDVDEDDNNLYHVTIEIPDDEPDYLVEMLNYLIIMDYNTAAGKQVFDPTTDFVFTPVMFEAGLFEFVFYYTLDILGTETGTYAELMFIDGQD